MTAQRSGFFAVDSRLEGSSSFKHRNPLRQAVSDDLSMVLSVSEFSLNEIGAG